MKLGATSNKIDELRKKFQKKLKVKMFRAFFENILAAENHRKIFQVFDEKKIFEVNAFKVGATSNIMDELRKNFQKNKGLKKL